MKKRVLFLLCAATLTTAQKKKDLLQEMDELQRVNLEYQYQEKEFKEEISRLEHERDSLEALAEKATTAYKRVRGKYNKLRNNDSNDEQQIEKLEKENKRLSQEIKELRRENRSLAKGGSSTKSVRIPRFPVTAQVKKKGIHDPENIAIMLTFFNMTEKELNRFNATVQFIHHDEVLLESELSVAQKLQANGKSSWYGAFPFDMSNRDHRILKDIDNEALQVVVDIDEIELEDGLVKTL